LLWFSEKNKIQIKGSPLVEEGFVSGYSKLSQGKDNNNKKTTAKSNKHKHKDDDEKEKNTCKMRKKVEWKLPKESEFNHVTVPGQIVRVLQLEDNRH
jgi:hypothetical protein